MNNNSCYQTYYYIDYFVIACDASDGYSERDDPRPEFPDVFVMAGLHIAEIETEDLDLRLERVY